MFRQLDLLVCEVVEEVVRRVPGCKGFRGRDRVKVLGSLHYSRDDYHIQAG